MEKVYGGFEFATEPFELKGVEGKQSLSRLSSTQ